MAPLLLPSNQPPNRIFRGGDRISAFRSEPPSDSYQGEDWVASTTPCQGCAASKLGMTTLPNGTLLADEIAANPEIWLGHEHIKKFGIDTKLLFKLLDAGQRLPIHSHPHADWAKSYLGTLHGKAEAWYILTQGEVYLGLKEDVLHKDLLGMVNNQDTEALLTKMHQVPVRPHETVYVPPGMLHAIGQGVFIAEVQEPEDLSVLCEWKDFAIDGAKHGHLGLGFDTALKSVDLRGRSRDEIEELVNRSQGAGTVLIDEAREYFELERVLLRGQQSCRRGFAILVVLEGDVALNTAFGGNITLKRGNTVVLPRADGDLELIGTADVLIARPPQTY